jgi:hypothetical protein
LALAASQSLYHLPLTLADRLGFFRQAGVQLEWLPQESGAKALRMALTGQADVVAGAYEHLFGLHLKGLNYQRSAWAAARVAVWGGVQDLISGGRVWVFLVWTQPPTGQRAIGCVDKDCLTRMWCLSRWARRRE